MTEARIADLCAAADQHLRAMAACFDPPPRRRRDHLAAALATCPPLRRAEARDHLASADEVFWRIALSADRVAVQHARAWPVGVTADNIQAARLGAFDAAIRFDPRRRVRFRTYARWWIRAALTRYSPHPGVSYHLRETWRNIERARAEAPHATDAELRERTGATPAQFEAALATRYRSSWLSLEDPLGSTGLRIGDSVAAEQVDGCDARDREILSRALDDLSPRHRHVAIERLCQPERRTLVEVGTDLGLSRERVRVLEMESLSLLRQALRVEVRA